MIAPVKRVLESGSLLEFIFASAVRSMQDIPKLVHDSFEIAGIAGFFVNPGESPVACLEAGITRGSWCHP